MANIPNLYRLSDPSLEAPIYFDTMPLYRAADYVLLAPEEMPSPDPELLFSEKISLSDPVLEVWKRSSLTDRASVEEFDLQPDEKVTRGARGGLRRILADGRILRQVDRPRYVRAD